MYSKKRVQQEADIKSMKAELERAMSDMQELLASEDCGYLGDCEEVVAGRVVLKEAQVALRHPRGTGPVPLIPPVLRGR